MAKLNTAPTQIKTHEGATAKHIAPIDQLRRSVMSCLLWESEFYEDGEDIATRIARLVSEAKPEQAAQLAIEARHQGNLRHVPLLICAAMARHCSGQVVGKTIEQVISRADELAEFVALVCKVNGVSPGSAKSVLSAQAKKGLAHAFAKFNEYSLAKYNRDGKVKLRDVLRLCHPNPKNAEQADLWKRLNNDQLQVPDTWEVALSSGADKRETFERLMKEGNLGYLALLRNLRNMMQSGCDVGLVKAAIAKRKGADKVLPFRFIAAARHAPMLEPDLDVAMQKSITDMPKLDGKTVVLVDVSGSMDAPMSGKSDLNRIDAAAALASIINCDDLRVFSFSNHIVEVPPRRGMAGVDAIIRSQSHQGTNLGGAIKAINEQIQYERLIVITDEQSGTHVPDPVSKRAYMINVASARNGVGYGRWTHIDGFSESVLRFITEHERKQL